MASVSLRAVVGTYQGLLFGLECKLPTQALANVKFKVDEEKQPAVAARTVFSCDAHIGDVRCLAVGAAAGLVASGGSDETVHIYDPVKCIDYGPVYGQKGSVNGVQFFSSTYLLSASDDGVIYVWTAPDWSLMSELKAHSGPVHDIAIHPSGRVFLSVGKDRTLRLWNLQNGALVSTRKLHSPGTILRWSPTGDRYVIVASNKKVNRFVSDQYVSVYATDQPDELLGLTHTSKVCSLCFINDNLLTTGTEDGKIHVWNYRDGTEVAVLTEHKTRVRGLDVTAATADDGSTHHFLASADSGGLVVVWLLSPLVAASTSAAAKKAAALVRPVCRSQSDHRLTCVALVQPASPQQQQPAPAAAAKKPAKPAVAKKAPAKAGGAAASADVDEEVAQRKALKAQKKVEKRKRNEDKAAAAGAEAQDNGNGHTPSDVESAKKKPRLATKPADAKKAAASSSSSSTEPANASSKSIKSALKKKKAAPEPASSEDMDAKEEQGGDEDAEDAAEGDEGDAAVNDGLTDEERAKKAARQAQHKKNKRRQQRKEKRKQERMARRTKAAERFAAEAAEAPAEGEAEEQAGGDEDDVQDDE